MQDVGRWDRILIVETKTGGNDVASGPCNEYPYSYTSWSYRQKKGERNVNNLLRLIGRRLVALPIMALGVTASWCSSLCRSKTDPAYGVG